MGVIADFLAGLQTISNNFGGPNHVRRQLGDILRTHGDFGYPTGYDAINEVQSIAIYSGTVSGGTFTLTSPITGAVATSALAFGAVAATIQTAVDTAMAGVAGYVAGHLAITGGPLTTTPLTLTYSGASVAGKNQPLITANGASLSGGGSLGAISTSTAGATQRSAWALLKVFGIITSAPPEQGLTLSGPTVGLGRGAYPFKLSAETIKAIIDEAAYDDGGVATVKSELLAALKY